MSLLYPLGMLSGGSHRTPCDGAVVAAAVPSGGCSPVAAVYDRRVFSLGWPGLLVVRVRVAYRKLFPLRHRGILILALFLLTLPLHADITGTVTLQGKPGSEDETFSAKANGCGESPIRHTENWKVGPKGELADVVVWVVDPKFEPVSVNVYIPPRIEVKQLGCRYIPHVIAVQSGVPFDITNGDPTLHNVRAKNYDGPGKPPGADIFNFGQVRQGQTDEKQFDQPGIATLQCDVHAWMQCWVCVLPNSCFAVTDIIGTFQLHSTGPLLDGDYKVRAWHPRFADQLEQTVHVKNGTAQVKFQFDGGKSF